jgi:hypothetical protein
MNHSHLQPVYRCGTDLLAGEYGSLPLRLECFVEIIRPGSTTSFG